MLVFIALCVSKSVLVQAIERKVYIENGITYYYNMVNEDGKLDATGQYVALDEIILPEDYGTEIVIPSVIDGHKITIIELSAYRWNGYDEYGANRKEVDDIRKIVVPAGTRVIFYNGLKDCIEQIEISGEGKITFVNKGEFASDAYKNLKSVVAADGAVAILENNAFAYSTQLTELSCSVEKVGVCALRNTGIADITLSNPGGKISIYRMAFTDCSNLKKLEFDADEVILYDDCLYKTSITELVNNSGELTICASKDREDSYVGLFGIREDFTIKKVSARDGVNLEKGLNYYNEEGALEVVENIKTMSGTLSGNSNLKKVTFLQGNDIAEIPAGAFGNCTSLESIELPQSVTKIGRKAFLNSNIKEITIPDSVTDIGAYAFAYCKNLVRINMPICLDNDNIVAYCDNLSEIHFTSGSDYYYVLRSIKSSDFVNIYIHDGVEAFGIGSLGISDYKIYTVRDKLTESTYDDLNEFEYIHDLKDGEKVSGKYVYKIDSFNQLHIVEYLYNTNETEIEIPEYIDEHRVMFIEDNAFSYCRNLQKVYVPDSVVYIGKNVFKGCKKLNELKLSSKMGSINQATYNTSEMTRIEIPGNIKSVYYGAIIDCDKLEEVVVDEGVETLDCNFSQCDMLKKIYIPKSVNTIYASNTSERTYYVYKDSYAHKFMQENGFNYVVVDESSEIQNGWVMVDGVNYWYENGERQGARYNADGSVDNSYRGKEIYDPSSDAWYWLDNVQNGAVAKSKDVYQESEAGTWGDRPGDDGKIYGKWVRYDAEGHMVKGWQTTEAGTYYFDPIFGTMAKGEAVIDGQNYYFDIYTGVLQ